MIVKLDKNKATTEDMKELFHFDENEFYIWPNRIEKVKFLGIKHRKDLNFLGTLTLRIWGYWDTLIWYKKHKL